MSLRPWVAIWGATERLSGRRVRRAATLDAVFCFGPAPADADPPG
jgi:hypothetical protein